MYYTRDMAIHVIPVRELNQNTSAVMQRVQTGEELLISVSGKPVARLSPLDPAENQLRVLARCALSMPGQARETIALPTTTPAGNTLLVQYIQVRRSPDARRSALTIFFSFRSSRSRRCRQGSTTAYGARARASRTVQHSSAPLPLPLQLRHTLQNLYIYRGAWSPNDPPRLMAFQCLRIASARCSSSPSPRSSSSLL